MITANASAVKTVHNDHIIVYKNVGKKSNCELSDRGMLVATRWAGVTFSGTADLWKNI